mmetsp:Transcript_48/g.84  ORF Transcript_48/g.84 Transcript_48/m.84 type:complete len:605 (-) Transcript_48:3800-5614(-)
MASVPPGYPQQDYGGRLIAHPSPFKSSNAANPLGSPYPPWPEPTMRTGSGAGCRPIKIYGAEPAAKGWVLEKRGSTFSRWHMRLWTLRNNTIHSQRELGSDDSWALSLRGAQVSWISRRRRIARLCFPLNQSIRFRIPNLVARRADGKSSVSCTAESWCRQLRRGIMDTLEESYFIRDKIGQGSYGSVHRGICRDTGCAVAIKKIDLKPLHEKEKEFIGREVQFCQSLSHPSIVKTIDIYGSRQEVDIVMELLEGGDLFDAIADENNFSEKMAAEIISDILRGVAYLHENDIIHRDLKPENILCVRRKWPIEVKITDLGSARSVTQGRGAGLEIIQSGEVMKTIVGTVFYQAPEVIRGKPYSFAVDIWACGVILFAMIAGKLPWPANDEKEYCEKMLTSRVVFPETEWRTISRDAKSMIRGLLHPDPMRRLTATSALSHPWLRTEEYSLRRIPTDRSVLSASRRMALPSHGASKSIRQSRLLSAALASKSVFDEESEGDSSSSDISIDPDLTSKLTNLDSDESCINPVGVERSCNPRPLARQRAINSVVFADEDDKVKSSLMKRGRSGLMISCSVVGDGDPTLNPGFIGYDTGIDDDLDRWMDA